MARNQANHFRIKQRNIASGLTERSVAVRIYPGVFGNPRPVAPFGAMQQAGSSNQERNCRFFFASAKLNSIQLSRRGV